MYFALLCVTFIRIRHVHIGHSPRSLGKAIYDSPGTSGEIAECPGFLFP